jgi:hypothetical protein
MIEPGEFYRWGRASGWICEVISIDKEYVILQWLAPKGIGPRPSRWPRNKKEDGIFDEFEPITTEELVLMRLNGEINGRA